MLPGGFSYGDYLRCGAIAAAPPVMDAVRAHAARGGLVLGICNGFQILCEAGLLPGALMRNASLQLRLPRCSTCASRPPTRRSRAPTPRARSSDVPIAHGEGNYFADADTLARSRARAASPSAIATRMASSASANPERLDRTISPASYSSSGNVLGMMPHPENLIDAADRRHRRRGPVQEPVAA